MRCLSVRRFDWQPLLTAILSLAILLIFVIPLSVRGQGSGRASSGTGGGHVIQGYVFAPSGRRADGLPLAAMLQDRRARF